MSGTSSQNIKVFPCNNPELSSSSISNSLVARAADIGLDFSNNVTKARVRTDSSRRSSTSQHNFNNRQSPGVAQFGRAGIAFAEAALSLSRGTRQKNVAFEGLDFDNTVLENSCPTVSTCNANSKFRTIDGSCNNLKQPLYGKSFTPLQRVLDSDYSDGFTLPRVAKNGQDLPSARLISTTTRFNEIVEDPNFTSLLVAFGQFLDHDTDHVPISSKFLFTYKNRKPFRIIAQESLF